MLLSAPQLIIRTFPSLAGIKKQETKDKHIYKVEEMFNFILLLIYSSPD